jgi:hypothetical protein
LTAHEADAAFHPEDIARSAIDRQLATCGWVVQSRADMNVGVSQGVAVREFQTDSGPVDYALFIDRRLRGVIEAKAEGVTLSAFSEQAERSTASTLDSRSSASAPRSASADRRSRRDGNEKKAVRSALDGDIYTVTQIRLPLLLRLDEMLSGGSAIYNLR